MQQYIFRKFDELAEWTSESLGSPFAFTIALFTIVVWALTGPYFGYSDVWQLIINTGTTIATFLMCFLLQNTSNRSQKQLLDHINARTAITEKHDEHFETIYSEFKELHLKIDSFSIK